MKMTQRLIIFFMKEYFQALLRGSPFWKEDTVKTLLGGFIRAPEGLPSYQPYPGGAGDIAEEEVWRSREVSRRVRIWKTSLSRLFPLFLLLTSR